ncbi:MAG: MFS transporter [Bacteroidetes bacterium]|nr:MAG: MFS transporter [Bacteroidota bacterium]
MILDTFKKYPRTFWVANSIELIERAAWYGFFMLFANYLTESSDLGGLEFTQSQKGTIMGVGTGILYFLPVITGAIADRFGYKKVLILAFSIYTSAFLLFPLFHSFTGVFIMYLYLALGAALFKPIISATIAKTTTDETSSIGFGIFYMMVNLGAFIGPMITLLYRENTFYISGGIIALNFVLLLFYKEPGRMKDTTPIGKSFSKVFKNIGIVVSDLKFMLFLLIISGFWTMYNQLFFALPVFISQWVDSSVLFQFFSENFPSIAANYSDNGQMDSEFITNFDAMFIIIFQILISSIVMKLRPISTMVTGFIIATIGMGLTVYTQNVMFTIVAIFIFSIGEMSASPKITEYIGRIAPADKKALFMGFSFIPLFLGNVLAGIVSGPVYQALSDKAELAKDFALKNNIIIETDLSKKESFEAIASQANMTASELTNQLWALYHPNNFWYVILGIGFLSAASLFAYDKLLMREK